MTVSRIDDASFVQQAVVESKPELDFDAIEWLASGDNIALSGEDGSLGLFDLEYPGLYTGHYFFTKQTRGKKAKELATEMIRYMFVEQGARSLRGLTPLTNQAARWMTRKLGFLGMGVIETTVGPCELFVLTPDRFYQTLNEKAQ